MSKMEDTVTPSVRERVDDESSPTQSVRVIFEDDELDNYYHDTEEIYDLDWTKHSPRLAEKTTCAARYNAYCDDYSQEHKHAESLYPGVQRILGTPEDQIRSAARRETAAAAIPTAAEPIAEPQTKETFDISFEDGLLSTEFEIDDKVILQVTLTGHIMKLIGSDDRFEIDHGQGIPWKVNDHDILNYATKRKSVFVEAYGYQNSIEAKTDANAVSSTTAVILKYFATTKPSDSAF